MCVDGTLSGGVNQEAIDHYNKMIDMLIEYGKCLVCTVHMKWIPLE